MDTNECGREAESRVAAHLEERGYRILERNYRCRYGEIDIISLSPDAVLCVTEVKSLTGRWPASDISYMIDSGKRSRLEKTLKQYLSNGCRVSFSGIRFDCAAVTDGRITYYSGDDC